MKQTIITLNKRSAPVYDEEPLCRISVVFSRNILTTSDFPSENNGGWGGNRTQF